MTEASVPIGWIVDAQVDFMEPRGRLYVRDLQNAEDPGALLVVDALTRARDWMQHHARVLVFTGDWHGYDDAEIDPDHPDPAAGTYPPHCMGRSDDPDERRGAEIIPALRPENPVVLGVDATEDDAEAVAEEALASGRPIFIRKTRFDVFTGNPSTGALLRALAERLDGPLRFVVGGVARDVCVTQAVDGMLERQYAVTALTDATWGLGLEPEEKTLARWRSSGRCTLMRTSELPA